MAADIPQRRGVLERDDCIGKILEIAGDYRKGEIPPFDHGHVERWVEQFPVSDKHKNVILREVGHMLETYYISRDCAKEGLLRVIRGMKNERLAGRDVMDVNFLRTQESGKSQSDLLLVVDEILQEEKGIATQDCGGSNVYLYLDDCMYSGNKWRYDIKNSTQLAKAKNGMVLISYHLAIYSGGLNYARGYVDKCLSQKSAELKQFRSEWYNNERIVGKDLDVLWPMYVPGNTHVDTFVSRANAYSASKGWNARVGFRTDQNVSGNTFTSQEGRHIVEQAFLAAGAKMFCAAQNPAPSMRPMGFEVIATIGFGTPIVTWRNIANNSPLALWYGDPSYGPNHPLGMWYPLFPRKTQGGAF